MTGDTRTPYTPTLDEARADWVRDQVRRRVGRGIATPELRAAIEAEFDRMIAKVRADALRDMARDLRDLHSEYTASAEVDTRADRIEKGAE